MWLSRIRRRWFRTVVPLVALVLVSQIALLTPNSQAQATVQSESAPLQDELLETAALQLAVDSKLSVDEARRQMADQDRLSGIASSAAQALGDSFAGAYIDHENSGTLVVQSTDSNQLDAWQRESGFPENTSTHVVPYSESYLEGPVMQQALESLEAPQVELVSAIFLADSDSLQVRVPVGEGVKAKDALGKIPNITIQEVDQEPASSCNTTLGSLTCASPLRGGIYVKGANHSACTVGFMVRAPRTARSICLPRVIALAAVM